MLLHVRFGWFFLCHCHSHPLTVLQSQFNSIRSDGRSVVCSVDSWTWIVNSYAKFDLNLFELIRFKLRHFARKTSNMQNQFTFWWFFFCFIGKSQDDGAFSGWFWFVRENIEKKREIHFSKIRNKMNISCEMVKILMDYHMIIIIASGNLVESSKLTFYWPYLEFLHLI